jgi:hypothetical protein
MKLDEARGSAIWASLFAGQLERIADAWNAFHANRARDAVYAVAARGHAGRSGQIELGC